MNQEQQDNAMSQIIAKCWADETFKQTLIADPKATLTAAGYPVPVHLSINIIEDPLLKNKYGKVPPIKGSSWKITLCRFCCNLLFS